MANVYRDRGDLNSAENLLSQCLTSWGETSQSPRDRVEAVVNRAFTLTQLGNVVRLRKEAPLRAFQYYADAMKLWGEYGSQGDKAYTLHDAATFFEWLGYLEKAQHLLEQALAARNDMGDVRAAASTLHELANISRLRGQLERAEQMYTDTLSKWEQTPDRQGRAITHRGLACLYRDTGRFHRSGEYLKLSMELWEEIGSDAGKAYTLHEMGLLETVRNNWDAAVQFYERALPLWHAMGDARGESSTLVLCGGALLGAGDPKLGRERIGAGLSLMTILGSTTILGVGLQDIAKLLRTYGLSKDYEQQLKQIEVVQSLPEAAAQIG
jgi:tetratricopeptide (TPR) repeat protein